MQQHWLVAGHRQFMQEAKETEASQVELFLNSVPLLASLSREEKLLLVDALEEQTFPAGTCVVKQVHFRSAPSVCNVIYLFFVAGSYPGFSSVQQGSHSASHNCWNGCMHAGLALCSQGREMAFTA